MPSENSQHAAAETEPTADLLDRMLNFQERAAHGDRDADYQNMALAIRRQLLRRYGAMQAKIDLLAAGFAPGEAEK